MLCADYSIETLFDQETALMDLCYPKTSLMDFNISAALHYASKGEGFVFDPAFFSSEEYATLKA